MLNAKYAVHLMSLEHCTLNNYAKIHQVKIANTEFNCILHIYLII